MTAKRLEIEHKSKETLRIGLISRNDPTGTAPAFQLTDAALSSPVDTDWDNGTWETVWDPITGAVVAVSPVTNVATHMTLAENTAMKAWIKWVHGTEIPVKMCILLDVK